MLKDVESVLDLAAEQMDEIESIYQETLAEQEVSGRLQALIKGVIEHNRSVLDYVANAVAEKHGPASAKVYWPYATTPEKFDNYFDKNLPGVRASRPELVTAWKTYQPYESGFEWIGYLIELAKGNKHRVLTPQTKTETVRMEVHGPGGSVSWDPSGVTFSAGVQIMGQPMNPVTQRTPNTVRMVYVDWRFADPDVSALATLRDIQTGMRPMLHELCRLANL
jgi:hypothetical protein